MGQKRGSPVGLIELPPSTPITPTVTVTATSLEMISGQGGCKLLGL